jgi:D-proline reductase (dithiol) PrdB
MASYQEMSLHVRLFMRKYPFHRYRIDPVPCTPLSKPLSEASVAIVTTAGLHLPDQPDFDHGRKLGDPSFREIPSTIDPQILRESHRSQAFDHEGIAADKNLAFPLDRLREAEAAGRIGRLHHRHFSFMGSIIGPRPLMEETAPAVAALLREDGVDVALLTPL